MNKKFENAKELTKEVGSGLTHLCQCTKKSKNCLLTEIEGATLNMSYYKLAKIISCGWHRFNNDKLLLPLK